MSKTNWLEEATKRSDALVALLPEEPEATYAFLRHSKDNFPFALEMLREAVEEERIAIIEHGCKGTCAPCRRRVIWLNQLAEGPR